MTKRPNIQRLLQLQELLLQFQGVHRVVHLPVTREEENDTEHSYNLALTAWFLAAYFPHLDRDLVIRYALVHDLVEIHAGDTYIYADQAILDSKHDREAAALKTLIQDWPDFADMTSAITEYEKHQSEEAKFIYALDKIMPIMAIFLGKGYTWQQEGITLDRLHEAKRLKVAVSKDIQPYYDELYSLLEQNRHYFTGTSKESATSESHDEVSRPR